MHILFSDEHLISRLPSLYVRQDPGYGHLRLEELVEPRSVRLTGGGN